MALQFKQCEGCPHWAENFDHIHQYIGGRGDAVTTYMVDGIAYTSPLDLVWYLTETYGVTNQEAHQFIDKLPRKYN